jgi:hypothetical protein
VVLRRDRARGAPLGDVVLLKLDALGAPGTIELARGAITGAALVFERIRDDTSSVPNLFGPAPQLQPISLVTLW